MVSQTSSRIAPVALANEARKFAAMSFGGPHDEPTPEIEAWAGLVFRVVYASALLAPMESAESVEELAKEALHSVLTNPGDNGNTDVDGGSVYRMLTLRQNMSYINHGHGDCNRQCCISIYDQLERR